MITTTPNSIDGRTIRTYLGVISSETIIGANVFKDILGGLRDFFGGRSGTYEKVMEEAKVTALRELEEKARAMGADAIVGIDGKCLRNGCQIELNPYYRQTAGC
jgi:uncharacterized protein YbjQ (UPF0145 family)